MIQVLGENDSTRNFMKSFQNELENYLIQRNIQHESNVDSFNSLDFVVHSKARKENIYIEVKEKKQHYSMKNWPHVDIPEEQLLIFDDLSARKILKWAPLSCLLVKDATSKKYHFFSVVDLFLMPKIRVNRPIEKNHASLKGKWFVDFRNAFSTDKLPLIFDQMIKYIDSQEDIFVNKHECYGSYEGEIIGVGGIIRRPAHWNKDVEESK